MRKSRLARLRFRRQHPIGPYILDFYCPAARLAVEVDGLAHDAAVQIAHDDRRRTWLNEHRITVLRVAAGDVLHDEKLESVLTAIEGAAGAPLRLASLGTSPAARGRIMETLRRHESAQEDGRPRPRVAPPDDAA